MAMVKRCISQSDHSRRAAHTYAPSYLVIPADPHPTLVRELGLNGQTPSWQKNAPQPSLSPEEFEDDPPLVLAARAFAVKDVIAASRVAVSSDELAAYKCNPDQLPAIYFLSSATPGEEEAFRLSSILLWKKEKFYYVVFADEGPEAVCHTADAFFELLSTSYRLVYNS
jgi:hypothetical protein